MNSIVFLALYFATVNLIAFCLMGIDKRRARMRAFRIPEITLFSSAIIGGSIGAIIGMYFFRHKTRHWYFIYGMPLILIIQIALAIVLIKIPIQISFM
ncbi:MAG: DUF1294 domain-containing protein [Butyrivibrio sp.]|nr:DUF1294 domain-containing protein [Butyrivibrio sp.]